ncbi:MAG: dephospho-CoA kinase [Bacteroidales bacterium]|nr:dephospho-CoA kinase [Bacteroidales bacterium]
MMKIGLTGNIGSGKTLVSLVFEALGIPVFNADEEAKKLINSPPILSKLDKKFGMCVKDSEGKLNHKVLADIIFADPEALAFVNAIVHPAVRNCFNEWCQSYSHESFVIFEAAILIETSFYKQLDKIVLVKAPENIRMQRVVDRDRIFPEKVLARMKNQWSEEEKQKFAHFVIINDGSNPVVAQCLAVYKELIASC